MTLQLPQSTNKLNSPDHAFLHRVVAVDGSSPEQSITVDSNGQTSLTSLACPYVQTVTVAKSGGDFTSIQSAIDSITDAASSKKYAIQIYPGIYTENITMKNYVSLIGVPSGRRLVKIYGTSGTLVTMPTIEAHIAWVDLEMNPTSSSDIIIDATAGSGSTGFYRIEHSDITMSSSTNGIKPKILDANAGVGIYFISATMTYTMTGTTATGEHIPINLQSTNNLFYLLRSIARGTINDTNASLTTINDASGGYILMEICTLEANFTNASNSGTAAIWKITGSTTQLKQIRSVVGQMSGNGSGTGYAVYMDTTTNDGYVYSSANLFEVIDFANNYRYYIGSGDSLSSTFNRDVTTLEDIENGNLYMVDSQDPGVMKISGRLGIANGEPTTELDINSDEIRVRSTQTPSSASANGNAGTICWDSNYIYICIANNTWKRSPLSTW